VKIVMEGIYAPSQERALRMREELGSRQKAGVCREAGVRYQCREHAEQSIGHRNGSLCAAVQWSVARRQRTAETLRNSRFSVHTPRPQACQEKCPSALAPMARQRQHAARPAMAPHGHEDSSADDPVDRFGMLHVARVPVGLETPETMPWHQGWLGPQRPSGHVGET
jgi:hypothetical protein